jgi:hypothetical protein
MENASAAFIGGSQVTKSSALMGRASLQRGCALLERLSAIVLTEAEDYFYSSSYARPGLHLDFDPARGTWMR